VSVMCSAVRVAMPTVGEASITGPLATHVETCVPCKGEVVRYRSMYRGLEALDATRYRAPQGFVSAVTSELGPVVVELGEPRMDPRMDPRVPVAAAVVATAAAGTAVLYKLYRDRAA